MLVIRSPKNEAVLLKNHPVCVNPDQDFVPGHPLMTSPPWEGEGHVQH